MIASLNWSSRFLTFPIEELDLDQIFNFFTFYFYWKYFLSLSLITSIFKELGEEVSGDEGHVDSGVYLLFAFFSSYMSKISIFLLPTLVELLSISEGFVVFIKGIGFGL